MNSRYLLGLMSIVMLTACGKSMQLTTKAHNIVAQDKTLANKLALTGPNIDGQLLPLSQFDSAKLKTNLPFLDASDQINMVRTVGSPAFQIDGETTDGAGFVQSSNVVFRAIMQVPPKAESIASVDQFKLVLHGVRLYVASGQKLEDVIANQLLCMLDFKTCAGGKIDLSDKNINKAYLADANQINQASLALASQFTLVSTLSDGSAVYEATPAAAAPAIAVVTPPTSSSGTGTGASAPKIPTTDPGTTSLPTTTTPMVAASTTVNALVAGDLEIDLQSVFGLKAEEVDQWVIAHSTVFDSTGNYRKFQFVMGNNMYFSSGKLDYEFTVSTDKSKVPANWNSAIGTPLNSDSDLRMSGPSPSLIAKEKIDATALAFTDDKSAILNSASLEKLKAFSVVLIANQDSIGKIRVTSVMDLGDGKPASKQLGINRATAVAKALTDNGVKAAQILASKSEVVKTSACAPLAVCLKDRMIDIKVSKAPGLASDKSISLSKTLSDALKALSTPNP